MTSYVNLNIIKLVLLIFIVIISSIQIKQRFFNQIDKPIDPSGRDIDKEPIDESPIDKSNNKSIAGLNQHYLSFDDCVISLNTGNDAIEAGVDPKISGVVYYSRDPASNDISSARFECVIQMKTTKDFDKTLYKTNLKNMQPRFNLSFVKNTKIWQEIGEFVSKDNKMSLSGFLPHTVVAGTRIKGFMGDTLKTSNANNVKYLKDPIEPSTMIFVGSHITIALSMGSSTFNDILNDMSTDDESSISVYKNLTLTSSFSFIILPQVIYKII
ncbi:MAG: hypothetical protein ACW98X_26495 [Promethearchaeota archaeon]|jgi:hypothetical protein